MFGIWNAVKGIGSGTVINSGSLSSLGLATANKIKEEALNHENRGDLHEAKNCYEIAINQADQLYHNIKTAQVEERLAALCFYYGSFLRKQGDKYQAERYFQRALTHAGGMDLNQPDTQELFKQIYGRYGSFVAKEGSQGSSSFPVEDQRTLRSLAHYSSAKSNFNTASSRINNPAFEAHLSSLPPCTQPFFSQPLKTNPPAYTLAQPTETVQNTHHLAWCLQQDSASEQQREAWTKDAKQVVEAFKQLKDKDLTHIQEVVALSAIDHPELHRKITNALLDALKLEKSRLLNLPLLRGLSVMMLQRPYLTHDIHLAGDGVMLLRALLRALERIHADQNLEQTQALLQTLSLLLDQLVYVGVKEIDRVEIQEPLKRALRRFEDKKKYPELAWPIEYTRQALARLPNNEKFSEALIRRALPALGGISYLTTFGLKLSSGEGFIKGFEPDKLWEAYQCFKDAFSEIEWLKCAPWYGELCFIDILIGMGRLDLFGKLLAKNTGPRDEAYLHGLCDRLERIASIQDDAHSQDHALKLLKGLMEGQIAWAKCESIQQYAKQSLNRIALMWPKPDLATLEKEGYAPAAWHPFWQAAPHSIVLKAIQETAQHNAYIKRQQEMELRSKREPLAILGENIEEEYFKAWEEVGEIQDGLTMYVAPQATTVTDKDILFDLNEAVTSFLAQENNATQKAQVLLLRGEAGSGKSTFNRHLARRLWEEYSVASDERPIPLYISLPTIDRPNKDLLSQYFSDKCGFSSEQIEALRQSQRFILILDGYDEIPAEQRNLYADEKLDQWQAKIILSCRPEYLAEGYQNHLQPRGRSRVLLEYQLAPFSERLIRTYINQYVKHARTPWNAQDYQTKLARIPQIEELLGTPFLLKMALSVLPTLDKVQPNQVGLTRIKLYEQFVQTWFERSLARLKAIQPKLTDAQQKAFCQLEDEFIDHSQAFNTDFALALSEARTNVAEYSAITRRGMPQDKQYETFLSTKDEEKNLLRFSALLIRQQKQYRFIHKSIQEYLVARAVWEELENFTEFKSSNDTEQLSEREPVRVLWESIAPSIEVDLAALLNRLNIVEDLAIQRFLVERVHQNRALVKPLLAWIKVSTMKDTVSIAAANAITILVKAGIQFIGVNLKGIQIPGADLSFGVFDSAQLQGANLSRVKFHASWLREVNLSNAQMTGVQFGEWPYLQEKSAVYSCAYSPDGQTCAVGLENGKISLYATLNWEKKHTLEGHTDVVRSVAYSPSGAQIASCSDDNTVRLWDVHSGKPCRTLQGHTDFVYSVVYSPNGQQIASAGLDKTVRLWDAHSGEPSQTLHGHTGSVSCLAYSPSAAQIISGSRDGTIRVWDVYSGAVVHILRGHTGGVTSVAYSPNGAQIASGSWSQEVIRLWDAEAGTCDHVLHGHLAPILSIVYSPNGNQIASSSNDTTVRLWDVQTAKSTHTLQGHTAGIFCIAYSPSGGQLVSGSEDRTVRLWDTQGGTPRHIAQGHTDAVKSVAYSPTGEQIASCSDDQTVRLWNAHTGEALLTLQGHTAAVSSVAYSPSSKQLTSSGFDAKVQLWNVQSGISEHVIHLRDDPVLSVVYSPSGDQIAFGSTSNAVWLCNVRTWDLDHILEGHTNAIWSVAYSPSGDQIASGSVDSTVRLWDVRTGKLVHNLKGHASVVFSVAYSPNGDQIASGSKDNTVRLWDAHTGTSEYILGGHTNAVLVVAYSSSGEQIASGSSDNTVRLWDAKTGECQMMIQDCGPVKSLAWKEISGSHYLVIGSLDNSVRQWEIKKVGKGYKAAFCWSSTHNFLTARGVSIEGVRGLSEMNARLLKQRGAIA